MDNGDTFRSSFAKDAIIDHTTSSVKCTKKHNCSQPPYNFHLLSSLAPFSLSVNSLFCTNTVFPHAADIIFILLLSRREP